MELRTHDILKISDSELLVGKLPMPGWVSESLNDTPYVVVRREFMSNEMIPVGVRGTNRNERFAAFLPLHAIVEQITPESLVAKAIWTAHARFQQLEALQALALIKPISKGLNVQWGPTGSVGFELASGHHSVHDCSDLDLIMRVEQLPSLEVAKRILQMLDQVPVRTDVQIETPIGAVALAEYAQGNRMVLLRTQAGPRLVGMGGNYK
ncbi:MAG: malonate decarboxylase holo-ACP synthase [Paenibacillaceae bacterium]